MPIIEWWGNPGMQDTYNDMISINPFTGKIMRGIYLKRRLTTIGMFEMCEYESIFHQYRFQWMTSETGNISPALVQKFYAAYKRELKRQYPQGNLWKGSAPIISLMIHGMWVNIYPWIILRFLKGLDFQPPMNTTEIEY